METVLYVLGVFVLFAVCVAALFSLVFGLPGTFVILGAALIYAWATGFGAVSWATIGWLTGLAVLGEGIEFLASSAGAASARPSWRVFAGALLGSFVGGLLGVPFLFGVGALLGALAGAFAGAALAVAWEGGDTGAAFATGFAAMRGRLLGFVLKAAVAVAMVVLLAAALI
ncbi:DUF456 family protein [Candidatus Binatia bacterium]|nr:DUF456 family protein [Candidatus Binatia bacterium]